MALMKIKTTSITLGDIIVDVDTPLVLSAITTTAVTLAIDAGTATVEVEWTDATANVAATTAATHVNFNAAIEAGVADPYKIPVVSQLTQSGGYLEPETLYPFITYTVA